MSKLLLIGLVVIIVASIIIFAWLYFFNIYEVKVITSSKSLNVNADSSLEISVVPLNSFGSKIPFRSVKAKFEIMEGENLVTTEKKGVGVLLMFPKYEQGEVKVKVTPEVGLFSTEVKIKVE